ncbi:hypothetical protein [uncultured Litoreibacter sp.]|uniref:hypothetical protein n=1 Tax=uncultured Litoreibacter sp. TaxID=1392394 RepID=UPI0026041296|nr:hypothetical protein [uncultured Litoreibacter sp.]
MRDTPTNSRVDPFALLEDALKNGWQTVETIPLAGEGMFLALTITGIVRLVRNRNSDRRVRRADAYGPARISVISVDRGNYLGAIAWKWNDDTGT